MATILVPPSAPADDIREHLLEILASASFRTSARSQQFLQYVVDESIAGRSDSLKERVVGERVFGRDPAYGTGQDSIVRVKANEVRRRLAQFYEQHAQAPLRIEMVSGSYGVTVRRLETAPVDLPPTEKPRKWMWAAAGLMLVAAAMAYLFTPRVTRFDVFWQPFLDKSRPLLLCMPAPEAYRIYGKGRQTLIDSFRPRPPGGPAGVTLAAVADVRIVPETGLLIGLGDARAMAYLQAFAATHKRDIHIRPSAMTSFADLSAGPSLVVGGQTNSRNADLDKGSRFHHTKVDGLNVIWDRQTNQAVCTKPQTWEAPALQDCGLVTRLRHPTTGHAVLLAAGLDHYGTYAVGEFVTNRDQLQPVLAAAPSGWQDKNMQILFKVERLRDGVGAPQIKAIHVW